jgi:hypothetical protein
VGGDADWPSGPTALSAALLHAINHLSSARNRNNENGKKSNRARSGGGGVGTWTITRAHGLKRLHLGPRV